jgi:hypothetical protein
MLEARYRCFSLIMECKIEILESLPTYAFIIGFLSTYHITQNAQFGGVFASLSIAFPRFLLAAIEIGSCKMLSDWGAGCAKRPKDAQNAREWRGSLLRETRLSLPKHAQPPQPT